MGWIRSSFGCLSWVGAGVIVVLLLLKVLFFDVAAMGHNGMAPTLVRGERVLINKRAKPVLHSIAVCQHPSEDGWVVGRVAATAGQTIGSFRDVLRIDGQPVPFEERGAVEFYNEDTDLNRSVIWGTERIGDQTHRVFHDKNQQHQVKKTTVEDGQIYLLGDYRGYMGQDSRAYGPVDAATCRGTIVFRLTPTDALSDEIGHGYLQPVR